MTIQPITKNGEDATPKIFLESDALLIMQAYADGCDKEIGWLARVNKQGVSHVIHSPKLLKQTVTGVTVDIEVDGLNAYAEWVFENYPAEASDILNTTLCWGHSHVNMGVTPSGTDVDTLLDKGKAGAEYYIGLIINKKGDIRIDYADFVRGLKYENLPYSIVSKTVDYNGITQEIKDNVTVQKITTPGTRVYGRGYYHDWPNQYAQYVQGRLAGVTTETDEYEKELRAEIESTYVIGPTTLTDVQDVVSGMCKYIRGHMRANKGKMDYLMVSEKATMLTDQWLLENGYVGCARGEGKAQWVELEESVPEEVFAQLFGEERAPFLELADIVLIFADADEHHLDEKNYRDALAKAFARFMYEMYGVTWDDEKDKKGGK